MNENSGGDSHGGHGHSHSPFQAHHFDTPQQQYDAAKFGMWLFLVQEVLFFSGLFVAYAIFRFNYPEIFKWGHQFLSKPLGTFNTLVLLFSSLTAAWAVRCAQKSQTTGLVVCISITIACAFLFLGVKYVEYTSKFREGLFWSGAWASNADARLEHVAPAWARKPPGSPAEGHDEKGEAKPHSPGEAAVHSPGSESVEEGHEGHGYSWPPPPNAGVFFSIYFAMTGLHALHVIAGIAALTWLLVRASKGHFNADYFGPVDLVALYWHLVDLVWIYLFPMLYLIE